MENINKMIYQKDKYFHKDGKIADKVLKYCKPCKIVWEKYHYKGRSNFFFYNNFPKYGKTEEYCPRYK